MKTWNVTSNRRVTMKTWNVTWSDADAGMLISVKVYTMTGREERDKDYMINLALRKAKSWLNTESFLSLSISTPTITEESNG